MTAPSPNPRTIRLANSLQHWLLGLLLCCGGAIAWGVLFGWIGSWATWWFNRHQTFESTTAHLRDNGELYLNVTRYRKNQQVQEHEYKTVEGQPIVLKEEELKRTVKSWNASAFSNSYRSWPHESKVINLWIDAPEPLPLQLSLMRFRVGDEAWGNGQHWYFHRPRHPGGSGFFEGFDLKTKRRIGFIGMNGFSETAPPATEQFLAWDITKSKVAEFTDYRYYRHFPPIAATSSLNEPGESPEYGLWLFTPQRDQMFAINFTRRSVTAKRDVSSKLLGTATRSDETGRSPKETRALFWENRLEIVSPALKTIREIPFPAELHGKISSFSELPSGEFEATHWSTSPKPGVIPADQHFVRFNERGEATLRKSVTIPLSKSSGYWFAEQHVVPLMLMPISMASWLAPYRSSYFVDQDGKPLRRDDEPMTWPLRFRALRIAIDNLGWNVSFWVMLLSGVPFAALCLWRQRTLPLSGFDRIAWPLLLCVFGIVGWIAFLTHRRWPTQTPGAIAEPQAVAA